MIKWDLCLTYQDGSTQANGLCYVGRKNKQTPPITLSDTKLRSLGFVTGSSYLAQASLESTMWPWQALTSWQSFCSVFQALRLQVCITTLMHSQQIPCRRREREHRPVKRTHREHHSQWQETEAHCSGKQGGLGRWRDG